MARVWSISALGAVVVMGCGGHGTATTTGRTGAPTATPAGGAELVVTPSPVLRACVARSRRATMPVLCPARLPSAPWSVRYADLAPGPSAYLIDLRAPERNEHTHLLVGGRRARFSLGTTQEAMWPVHVPAPSETCCATPGDLGLVGAQPEQPGTFTPVRLKLVRSATVATHPAVVLRAQGFPNGGIHGGHLIVVWNEHGHGYVLSMHAHDADQTHQAIVLRMADGMSRHRPFQ
jgi:hypothetical protein